MGMGHGSKLNSTRIWTAGFSPCFHLPEFYFGYLFLIQIMKGASSAIRCPQVCIWIGTDSTQAPVRRRVLLLLSRQRVEVHGADFGSPESHVIPGSWLNNGRSTMFTPGLPTQSKVVQNPRPGDKLIEDTHLELAHPKTPV